jgi:hypothetical protein
MIPKTHVQTVLRPEGLIDINQHAAFELREQWLSNRTTEIQSNRTRIISRSSVSHVPLDGWPAAVFGN